jgi:hypothetical protein
VKRLARAVPLLACVLAAGCGRDAVAPQDVVLPPPPIVEAMVPEPRSARVFYGTPIWVRFVEPLDSLTVNEQTVFLKVDTRRIAADIAWDEAGRRIVVTPAGELELNTTHTVRLSTALRTRSGTSLGQEYFWQFKTTSLRIPIGDLPAPGAVNKGPWAPLLWRGTEASAGQVVYRVHAGPDSAEVALRATPLGQRNSPAHSPASPWPLGTTIFWTITADNRTTGEVVDGPVGRFDTLPPGTPVDSLHIRLREWGYFWTSQPNNHPCYGDVTSGTNYTAAARYLLTDVPPGLELDWARVDALTPVAMWPSLPIVFPSIWPSTTTEWAPCTIAPGRPAHDEAVGRLANGTIFGNGRLRFESPTFVGHVQRALVTQRPIELVFRSERTVTYTGLVGGPVEGHVRVRYFRLPAPVAQGGVAR